MLPWEREWKKIAKTAIDARRKRLSEIQELAKTQHVTVSHIIEIDRNAIEAYEQLLDSMSTFLSLGDGPIDARNKEAV